VTVVRAVVRPEVRRVWALAVLAAAIAIGVVAVHKQVRDGNDFPIYWNAARDLLAGRSPYDVNSGLHGYVYLPWFALTMVPFALLPLPVAATCWYVLNLVFTFFAGRALLGSLHAARVPARPLVLALAALPLAALFHDNLVLGQANLFVLWLVALGIRAALRPGSVEHRGLPIGLAAALKMPAAVLALPLLFGRRARQMLGVVIGLVIAIELPHLEGGTNNGGHLMKQWHEKVMLPAAEGTLQGSNVIDQSPQAGLRRLLVAEPAFGDHRVNVAALDVESFRRVSFGASIAILVAYLLVWLLAPARGSPPALLADLALACCAMVQVTGYSLKAQFVVLLLPAWLAASLAWERPARAPRVLLVIAGALFLLSQPGLVGRAASNLLLAHSSMTLGTLLLAGTLAWQRFRLTPPPSAAPAAAPASGTTW